MSWLAAALNGPVSGPQTPGDKVAGDNRDSLPAALGTWGNSPEGAECPRCDPPGALFSVLTLRQPDNEYVKTVSAATPADGTTHLDRIRAVTPSSNCCDPCATPAQGPAAAPAATAPAQLPATVPAPMPNPAK